MPIKEIQAICEAHSLNINDLKAFEAVIALNPEANEDMEIFYAKKAAAYKGSFEFYNVLVNSDQLKDHPVRDVLFEYLHEDFAQYRLAKLYESQEHELKMPFDLRYKDYQRKQLFRVNGKQIDAYLQNSCSRDYLVRPASLQAIEQEEEMKEQRCLAEKFCLTAENAYEKEKDILSANQAGNVKAQLEKAKKICPTYDKLPYLFALLYWNQYSLLKTKSKLNKSEQVAFSKYLDETRACLSQAILCKEEGSQYVIKAYFLSIVVEIEQANKAFAREQYETLESLKQQSEYTETQVIQIAQWKDILFPEIKQTEAAKLAEEQFKKEQEAYAKREEIKAKLAARQAELFRERVEKRATQEGAILPLTTGYISYYSALEREKELVSIKDNVIRERKIKEILSFYDEALKENPDEHKIHHSRGLFKFKTDYYLSGIEDDFNKAAEAKGFKFSSYYHLGQLMEKLGNLSKAKNYYLAVVEDKTNTESDEAIKDQIEEALEIVYEKYEAHFYEIKVRCKDVSNKAQLEDFISDCEQFLEPLSESYDLHFVLAKYRLDFLIINKFSVEEVVRDYAPKIIEYFNIASVIDFNRLEPFEGLGCLYWNLGDCGIFLESADTSTRLWREAIKNYNKVIRFSPDARVLESIASTVLFGKIKTKEYDSEVNQNRLGLLEKIIESKHFKKLQPHIQVEIYIGCAEIYELFERTEMAIHQYQTALRTYGFVDQGGRVMAKINALIAGTSSVAVSCSLFEKQVTVAVAAKQNKPC